MQMAEEKLHLELLRKLEALCDMAAQGFMYF